MTIIDQQGDPGAMRATASMLRLRADTISELAARLDAQVAGLAYEGPAADEFRAVMADRRRTAEGLAGELFALSDRLLAAASEVEAFMVGGNE